MAVKYPTQIEILDVNLALVCIIKSPVPLNKSGDMLQYSRELSDYGTCKFRVSAYDPLFDLYGDVFAPHKYHVRIRRGSYVVWQGAIIANTQRTKSYVEIQAAEYEFYLNKILVTRSSPDENGTTNIYRKFTSGTMAEAVTAVMNETIAKYAASTHVLKNMTLGTVENPNFPPNLTSDYDQKALTGPWAFGSAIDTARGPEIDFDFHMILYILKSFGLYSYSDFKIDNNLVFNFKKFYGNNLSKNLVFQFGEQGNIIDYNLIRSGVGQANDLFGIAVDPNGIRLHYNKIDSSSIQTYGLMQAIAAYADVKSQSILNARTIAELPLISTPNETSAVIYLNENSYPLGMYDIGDLITLKIVNKGINFNEIRRIVGFTVLLHETGRERIAVQTNTPLDWQYQS